MDGLRITISPLFSLNLGYPLPFMQGFYNFQDSQNIKLGQYVEGGGGDSDMGNLDTNKVYRIFNYLCKIHLMNP